MNNVRISFVERSNGAAAEVKVEAEEGATTELLEDLANKAYEVAVASFEQATAYTATKLNEDIRRK